MKRIQHKKRYPDGGAMTPNRPAMTGWGLALVLVMAAACNSGPDENRLAVDAFLEQEVEKRIETYREIFFRQCREDILEEAGRIADSILIAEARLKRDTVDRPAKPDKPDKPEMKTLKDSLTLDPLFQDSITN